MLLDVAVLAFCFGTIAGEEYGRRHPREMTLAKALKIMEADCEDVVITDDIYHDSFYDGRTEGWV